MSFKLRKQGGDVQTLSTGEVGRLIALRQIDESWEVFDRSSDTWTSVLSDPWMEVRLRVAKGPSESNKLTDARRETARSRADSAESELAENKLRFWGQFHLAMSLLAASLFVLFAFMASGKPGSSSYDLVVPLALAFGLVLQGFFGRTLLAAAAEAIG